MPCRLSLTTLLLLILAISILLSHLVVNLLLSRSLPSRRLRCGGEGPGLSTERAVRRRQFGGDAAPEHIEVKEEMQSRRRGGFTFFHLDNQPFVRVLAGCVVDPDCSIQYLHRRKTGGTFIESKMYAILGRKQTKQSCCDNKMMDRFMENPDRYCTANFSAYQVSEPMFAEIILKKCRSIFVRETAVHSIDNARHRRMVVLVTYREPIARAVSFIHQVCNKHLDRRSKQTRAICKRCNYYDDPDFYNSESLLPSKGFKTLQHLYQGMLANRTFWSSATEGGGAAVDGLLAIDNADLDSLFGSLPGLLPPEFRKGFLSQVRRSNFEENQLCDFKVPSAMLKNMSQVILLYRNISFGMVLPH